MEQARFLTLFSSSKGNAAYIKYGRDEILIDCGVSAKMLDTALRAIGTSLSNVSALFITHEHSDHIRGLAVTAKHLGFPIYAPEGSCGYLAPLVANCDKRLHPLVDHAAVELFDTVICPVRTPHDSLDSCGFRIKAGDEKLGYFTDIGHLSENVLRGMSGCERVVVESNHDVTMLKNGSYPPPVKARILSDRGHLSNDSCSKLLPHLVSHGTRSIALAHLSEENNRPLIAFSAASAALRSAGIGIAGSEEAYDPAPEVFVKLRVAPACGRSEL